MRKPRIVADYLRNTDANLLIQGSYIISCMTSNAYFPSPTPTLAEVNTVLQQYAAALIAAQNHNIIQANQKKKLREQLETSLARLANYVMMTAGDDRAIMASSGFTIGSSSTSKIELEEVSDFSVEVGKVSGQATLSVKPMPTARFFNYFYAKAGDPLVWIQITSRYPSLTIDDLDPLTTYLFRVVAQGMDDATSESAVITKGVL